jgi:hypothetical protein
MKDSNHCRMSMDTTAATTSQVRHGCKPNGEAMTNPLARPLDLPCGATLSNRLAKAAMSEGLADSGNHSTPRLETLYRRWAGSGAGLLLSGNIQVDRWHLERPNNVVIDDDSGRAQLPDLPKPERHRALTSGLSSATPDVRSAAPSIPRRSLARMSRST